MIHLPCFKMFIKNLSIRKIFTVSGFPTISPGSDYRMIKLFSQFQISAFTGFRTRQWLVGLKKSKVTWNMRQDVFITKPCSLNFTKVLLLLPEPNHMWDVNPNNTKSLLQHQWLSEAVNQTKKHKVLDKVDLMMPLDEKSEDQSYKSSWGEHKCLF